MEKFALTLQSRPDIDAYLAEHHLMPYEKAILSEIVAAIASGDAEKLNWYAGFGDSFRAITMNLNEHSRALEFGFTGNFSPRNRRTFPHIIQDYLFINVSNHIWTSDLSFSFLQVNSFHFQWQVVFQTP